MGSLRNSSTNILLFIFLSSLSIHDFALAANSSSLNSRCIESEWKALMEFKASLVNVSSSALSSWKGRDCCTWHGITCHNSTGHVQMLELGYYQGYYYKDVHFNFSSPLSPWLFNLSGLEVLSIFGSGLRDPIPNMFQKLTFLNLLDLTGNSFNSPFPDSLCSLTSLSELHLSYSELRGPLPSCLGNMTSLTTIILGNNDLSGKIPSELGNLTHLAELDLSSTHLNSSIPSTLGRLSELEYLNLVNNQLSSTIPLTLGNLTKLTSLFSNANSLMGELSEFFFEGLSSLKSLDMSENNNISLKLSAQWIPPFQIRDMGMGSVFIGTEFPPWLQTQRSLEELSMSNAGISGAIPDWCLTTFPNITNIDLSNNLLTGPVPTFDIASLEILLLSGNHFIGTIPEELCNLKSLLALSLRNNKLIGRIPPCLGSLHNLSILDLGNNRLSGHIPNELGSLSSLHILHLNGNKLSGKLPELLQNLTDIATLDLGQNELQGSITSLIGKNWSNLQFLRLESNNFSGDIPPSLCQLPSLRILSLAVNNLVGTIPPCFGNLSMMLSEEPGEPGDEPLVIALTEPLLNIIKGIELNYTLSLRYAKFISLSGNHLHGQIPAELMNLKGLISLNLSNNELTGMIPETINNLKHLESLDLSMNQLSGTIPQSLGIIDALSYLNLSFNNLAGKVPSRNHLDTLNTDPSIYEGNWELCGKMLMKSCPGDDLEPTDKPNGPGSDGDANANDEFEFMWYCAGIGPGFAVGLIGVMFILYFKDEWRIAYFGLADNVYTRVRASRYLNSV